MAVTHPLSNSPTHPLILSYALRVMLPFLRRRTAPDGLPPMRRRWFGIVAAASVAAAAFVPLAGVGPDSAAQTEQDLIARARAIHDRVITLDTHNDIEPSNFTPTCNYT